MQPVENNRKTSASVPSGSNIKTAAQYPNDSSSRDPLIQDGQKTVTDGVPREETVWRHPSQLENGARETGQTVPLNIDHYEKDITDDNDTSSERYAASDLYANSEQTISTNAGGEEELLFRDSDLAFDGRLPGLEDMNPAVEGTLPASRPATADVPARKVDDIGEREATKALRRRASELVSKEGRLSVAKKSG